MTVSVTGTQAGSPPSAVKLRIPKPGVPPDARGRAGSRSRYPRAGGTRRRGSRFAPPLRGVLNREDRAMPMIDVYATAGTFTDKHQLATDLAATLMGIEGVPDIPMFRQNTAAFVHELPTGDISNVDGESNYVRVQVLTNTGALD